MKNIPAITSALVLAAGMLASAPAYATPDFDFSFTTAVGDTASGEFLTSGGASPFTVTGINGQFDGFAITGLSSYAGADQMLFFPGPIYADFAGISFSTANGNDYNLTNFVYPQGINDSNLDPAGNGSAVIELTSFVVTEVAVPEPTSMALLCSALIGFGFIIQHRRKPA